MKLIVTSYSVGEVHLFEKVRFHCCCPELSTWAMLPGVSLTFNRRLEPGRNCAEQFPGGLVPDLKQSKHRSNHWRDYYALGSRHAMRLFRLKSSVHAQSLSQEMFSEQFIDADSIATVSSPAQCSEEAHNRNEYWVLLPPGSLCSISFSTNQREWLRCLSERTTSQCISLIFEKPNETFSSQFVSFLYVVSITFFTHIRYLSAVRTLLHSDCCKAVREITQILIQGH